MQILPKNGGTTLFIIEDNTNIPTPLQNFTLTPNGLYQELKFAYPFKDDKWYTLYLIDSTDNISFQSRIFSTTQMPTNGKFDFGDYKERETENHFITVK